MTKSELTDLVRLARVGANALGQSANPQTMLQAWSIIANVETELSKPDPVPASPIVNE